MHANVDFGESSQLQSVNQIIYADDLCYIDYQGLEDKIPIKYVTHKDKVEYATIKFAMNDIKLTDKSNVKCLEFAADSNVDDEFAPANDEVIQAFVDFFWHLNYKSVVVWSIYYMTYGFFLVLTAFY